MGTLYQLDSLLEILKGC